MRWPDRLNHRHGTRSLNVSTQVAVSGDQVTKCAPIQFESLAGGVCSIMNRYRCWSLVASLVLLGCAFATRFCAGPLAEIVRPYLPDLFIVGWLYFCLSVVLPRLGLWTKGGITIGFASAVELFQATGIPDSPAMPRPLVFWIGNTFNRIDFVCYALGVLLAMGIDTVLSKRAAG